MEHVYYIDTSVLLKRYFEEDGSQNVEKLFSTNPTVFTSSITYAEFYATVYRIHRDAYLSKEELTAVLLQFEEDWKRLAVMDFRKEIRDYIPIVLEKVGLKGADSIHLASAYCLQKRDIKLVFICSDKKLLTGAKEFKIKISNPSA